MFKNPANKHRTVSLTAEQFRFAFGNAIPAEESDELFDTLDDPGAGQAVVRGGRGQLQPALARQGRHGQRDRGPLLLMMGGKDHTVPEAVTKSTLKQYRHSDAVTDIHEFPDRAHSLTIDHGWSEVADVALAWLAAHGADGCSTDAARWTSTPWI